MSKISKGAILCSCVLFASAVVLVKYTLNLLEPHPLNGVFISFVRFGIGAVLCLALMGAVRDGFHFRDKKILALRGLTGAVSMVFFYVAIHYIKIAREKNSPMVVYLVSCLFGVVISLVPTLMVLQDFYRQMTPLVTLLLLAIGTLVFIGQQLMTFGFKYVSATGGSILCLSEIVLTIAASAFFLDEKITARFLAGGVLVVGALVIALIERNDRDDVKTAVKSNVMNS